MILLHLWKFACFSLSLLFFMSYICSVRKNRRNLRVLEYVTNNRNAERTEETRSSNRPRQSDASRTPFSIYISAAAACLHTWRRGKVGEETNRNLWDSHDLLFGKHGVALVAREDRDPVRQPSLRRPPRLQWRRGAPPFYSAGGGSIGLRQRVRAANQDGRHREDGLFPFLLPF
jgi:hypothetical protein